MTKMIRKKIKTRMMMIRINKKTVTKTKMTMMTRDFSADSLDH